MATFLTTTDTSAAIERVIRGAQKELILISAYVYPRIIYLQRLKDAAERGVDITLIFGKRKMDARVMALFREIPNIRIYYLDVLHAKCFLNEKEAIVTSLNLLNGSEDKNREMGVRLDRETDADAYRECAEEIRSILAVADLVHRPTVVAAKKAKPVSLPVQGTCIRCADPIAANPDAPLCYEDFLEWIKYEDPDYREHYCHTCGKKARVSMAAPMCAGCLRTYSAALARVNKERRESDGFGMRRSWRRF